MNRHLSLHAIVLGLGLLSASALLVGCSGDPQKGKQKYLASGMRYMEKGRYQEAVLQFNNALKLDPRFIDAFYQLGRAHMAARNGRGARNAFESALAIDSGKPVWREEYRFRRKDETYADLLARALIVRDEKGKVVHIVGSLLRLHDDTDVRQLLSTHLRRYGRGRHRPAADE